MQFMDDDAVMHADEVFFLIVTCDGVECAECAIESNHFS